MNDENIVSQTNTNQSENEPKNSSAIKDAPLNTYVVQEITIIGQSAEATVPTSVHKDVFMMVKPDCFSVDELIENAHKKPENIPPTNEEHPSGDATKPSASGTEEHPSTENSKTSENVAHHSDEHSSLYTTADETHHSSSTEPKIPENVSPTDKPQTQHGDEPAPENKPPEHPNQPETIIPESENNQNASNHEIITDKTGEKDKIVENDKKKEDILFIVHNILSEVDKLFANKF